MTNYDQNMVGIRYYVLQIIPYHIWTNVALLWTPPHMQGIHEPNHDQQHFLWRLPKEHHPKSHKKGKNVFIVMWLELRAPMNSFNFYFKCGQVDITLLRPQFTISFCLSRQSKQASKFRVSINPESPHNLVVHSTLWSQHHMQVFMKSIMINNNYGTLQIAQDTMCLLCCSWNSRLIWIYLTSIKWT